MEELQSSYHIKHSTETGLLKVRSEVLSVFDKEGSIVVMLLFDLSASFDFFKILSDRLQKVNVKGTL